MFRLAIKQNKETRDTKLSLREKLQYLLDEFRRL